MEITLSLPTVVMVASILINLLLLAFLLLQRRAFYPSRGNEAELMAAMGRIDSMAREMETLTRAFTVPKTRGGMGERLLEDLLRAWLPPQYIELQHRFSSGARVDAAVRVGNRIVSIDAKFPYESLFSLLSSADGESSKADTGELRRVFSGYVDEIAAKYIRPEEGTFHFALLYIPSENLYYRAFIEEKTGMMDYALQHSVVPVSPGTLFIYLQTVAVGLKGFALSENQRELMDTLYSLRREFRNFAKRFTLAGNHLRNAARSFEESLNRFSSLETAVERTLSMTPADKEDRTD